MILRAVRMGWSLLVGAALGLARVHPRRLRPLDFGPFHEALESVPPERHAQVRTLVSGASVARVREILDRGELTAEELTLHLLGRIRRLDPLRVDPPEPSEP
jgi:hypothetical protein